MKETVEESTEYPIKKIIRASRASMSVIKHKNTQKVEKCSNLPK